MTSLVPILAVLAAAIAAAFVERGLRCRGTEMPRIFIFLTFVLPFAAGGFHTYTAMITTLILAGNLVVTVKQQKQLRFVWNLNTAAVILVTLGYCLTPLWAADKGMAVFAIPRYMPLLLYTLTLMQYPKEQRERSLELIPLSGAFMTVLSCILLLLPGMEVYLTVNGRLSAFLQYPNTYAAFLLAGIVIQNTKAVRSKADPVISAILIVGIILSGSRTGFVLMFAALLGIVWVQRRKKILVSMGIFIAGALALSVGLSALGLLDLAGRFGSMFTNAGSMLVRLLYFKDALPVILRNPFGLGYLGYRATETTFQTARYTVSFVHNGLLQLLLDIGWIPALLMAAAFLRTMFSKKTAPKNRLLLFVVLAHCMMDFDLQFFVIWVILLQTLDFEKGKQYCFKKQQNLGMAACAAMVLVCVWLGTGDLLYNLGNFSASLALTPFHTDALAARLKSTSDIAELDKVADRILELNPTNSLAYSAKANAAFSRGEVLAMMEHKERAIQYSRFTTEEYCDYFQKLYTVMQLYLQSGDTTSASYCYEKLRDIPVKMAQVYQETDPLADLTGEDTTLELPGEYLQVLTYLEAQNLF